MQINSSDVLFYTDLESFSLLVGIKVSFWSDVGDFKMTLERVRMQINSSEVLFYTDLESFSLLVGIKVSFWSDVGDFKMTL